MVHYAHREYGRNMQQFRIPCVFSNEMDGWCNDHSRDLVLTHANRIHDLVLSVVDLVLKWTPAVIEPFMTWFLT